MSVQTWRAEFLPVLGSDPSVTADWAAALDHSITKWLGFLPQNLEKHEVHIVGTNYIHEKDAADYVRIYHCALCERAEIVLCAETAERQAKGEFGHIRWDREEMTSAYCRLCPIYKATGTACNVYSPTRDNNWRDYSPWRQFVYTYNPEPMISVLQLTKEWMEKNEAKESK